MSIQKYIIYQPGFGGNLLGRLFSLDNSVTPFVSYKNLDRLASYSFGHANDFDHWRKFHQACIAETDKVNANDTTEYGITLNLSHPYQFIRNYVNIKINPCDVYMAELSYDIFPNYWIMGTKERWNHFPVLFPGEFNDEVALRSQYNPTMISMDKFLDESLWEGEYIRVSELMGVPVCIENARIIFDSWYKIRVKPLKETFNTLTESRKTEYHQVRVIMENTQYDKKLIYNNTIWTQLAEIDVAYKLCPDDIQKKVTSLGYKGVRC